MPENFVTLLGRVAGGESLSSDEMSAAMDAVISGASDEGQMALFLTALAAKGETAEEIAGAARSMRRHMTPIHHRYERLLDTCGTGGGGSELFNISTAAALVIAAAGVPVAKHGNRSVTSRSGSADVLAELGVNISATVPQVENCLNELGICFCFAPLMHPAMRNIADVRKKLGVRTIFNIIGPLANPAGASHQLLGAGRPELRPVLASALRLLEIDRAFVVSGDDGLGEVTLTGPTRVTEIAGGRESQLTFRPEDFGLKSAAIDGLRISGPTESAKLIRDVINGVNGAARDIVVLNAAAGLMLFDRESAPESCAKRAAEAIDSGAAADMLNRLADQSRL
jgi:anthranilate phosphoribosyltransferase